jgi:hypothetical protein
LSDIFREVEEEVRRERLEKIWKLYGDYIVAGIAILVIAVAGYELYARYQSNQRMQASETLMAAESAAAAGDYAKATNAYATVAKDAPGGYAKMAKLGQASALLANGQREEAIAIYKGVAADGGPIGDVALIRAGWAMAETAPRSDVQALLAPLTDPTNPWHYMAQEILAYADFHAGQNAAAQLAFAALAADAGAPQPIRTRADSMSTFLKQGGFKDYGTVPKPAALVATPAAPAAPVTAPAQ